jgi:alpha-tubulin suppressor-like RCC1 family protein
VGPSTTVPVKVVMTELLQIASGFQFGVGLTKDGKASYWGDLSGTLGTLAPVEFEGLSGVIAVTAQHFGGCGLENNGKVKCWGSNTYQALGVAGFPLKLEYVENVSDVVSLAAGRDFNCAVHKDGTVSCWGRNNGGQLGDPTDDASTSLARKVPGISGATKVACGGFHGCVIVAGGKIKCWGDSSANQSGNPSASTTEPVPPTEVQGISGAIDIRAGYAHSCARTAEGKLFCWGRNDSGQLGDGTSLPRVTPIEVKF